MAQAHQQPQQHPGNGSRDDGQQPLPEQPPQQQQQQQQQRAWQHKVPAAAEAQQAVRAVEQVQRCSDSEPVARSPLKAPGREPLTAEVRPSACKS